MASNLKGIKSLVTVNCHPPPLLLLKILKCGKLENWKKQVFNRLQILNNPIDYNLLNLTFTNYKLHCKQMYLNFVKKMTKIETN